MREKGQGGGQSPFGTKALEVARLGDDGGPCHNGGDGDDRWEVSEHDENDFTIINIRPRR